MEPGRSRQGRHRKNSGRLALIALAALPSLHCLPAATPSREPAQRPAAAPTPKAAPTQSPSLVATTPREPTASPLSTLATPATLATPKQLVMDELKRQVQEAIVQSRRSYYLDDPAVREQLRELAEDERAAPQELTLLERFFIYSVSPTLAAKADPVERARSYCAAMQSTSASWWGLPGPSGTPASRALVAMGRQAVPCLVELLHNQTPLHYLNGEAQTMTDNYSFVIADLAAGFLAEILKKPFDHEERSVTRRQAAFKELRAAAGR